MPQNDPAPRITAALETYRTALSAYNAVLKAARPVVGDGLGAMFERVCHAESDVADVLADDWPAVLARMAALEIIARRVTPTFLCEDEVEAIAEERTADTDIQCLAGYIRDQDIEIDRSHEREAAQGTRLVAAEAVIAAYKTMQAAQYKSNDYYAATAALEAAEGAYDALAGTGEGTRANERR